MSSENAEPDFAALIGEVANRHNVMLRPDDPALVVLTLNELMLDRYVQRIEKALHASLDQVSAGAIQQRAAAKILAEQAIAGGADYVAKTAVAAIDELRAEAAKERAAIRQAANEMQEARQSASWAALFTAGAIIALLIGASGASWLTR